MMVELRSVTKDYLYGKRVFNSLNLIVESGEIVAALGGDGSGKTTLLKLIAGADKPSAGEVLYNGEPLDKLKDTPVMMLFEGGALFDKLTVYDNLAYSLKIRGVDKKEIALRVIKAAGEFDLDGILYEKVKNLSVEERALVALSRTALRDYEILVMDEPLKGLEYRARKAVWAQLERYIKKIKKTVIFSTTELDEAVSVSDKIAALTDRGLEQYGAFKEIYYKPATMWAAQAVDKHLTALRGKLDKMDGKLVALTEGSVIDIDCLKDRLLSDGFIGCEVYICAHSEDIAVSDRGILFKKEFEKRTADGIITYFSNGIIAKGRYDDEVKLLPVVSSIMLFDKESESSLLK